MGEATDIVEIPTPLGPVRLRPEREDDHDFRYQLFCDSRLPEWYVVQIEPGMRAQLMQHQFHAQTVSYQTQFPHARFDIVELDNVRIGRIVVDRPGRVLHLVDHAIVPEQRNKGIGSTIMRALMDEASAAGIPVRLQVASANDPSMRLYLRLGFTVREEYPLYIEMEWNAAP